MRRLSFSSLMGLWETCDVDIRVEKERVGVSRIKKSNSTL